MSENTSKLHDLMTGIVWLASPEGQRQAQESRRGTHRINADPEHPDQAWLTLPDETVVHGRLLESGEFVPDQSADASDEAG